MVGTVAIYCDSPEFPEGIFIALEMDVGFGEGAGGHGVGSVMNVLHDLEGGSFVEMARIDELITNLPDVEALRRMVAVSRTRAAGEESAPVAGGLGDYPWEFAISVGTTTIEWV